MGTQRLCRYRASGFSSYFENSLVLKASPEGRWTPYAVEAACHAEGYSVSLGECQSVLRWRLSPAAAKRELEKKHYNFPTLEKFSSFK